MRRTNKRKKKYDNKINTNDKKMLSQFQWNFNNKRTQRRRKKKNNNNQAKEKKEKKTHCESSMELI